MVSGTSLYSSSPNQTVFAQNEGFEGSFEDEGASGGGAATGGDEIIFTDSDGDNVTDDQDQCPNDPSTSVAPCPADAVGGTATPPTSIATPAAGPRTPDAVCATDFGKFMPVVKECPTQGPKVKELQEILFTLGFYDTDDRQSVTTGFYGALTSDAVMKFQQNQDELRKMKGEPDFPEKDGNTGPETWKALCTTLDSQLSGTMQLQDCDPASPTLVKCPNVDAVRSLQEILKQIPPPGTFDPGLVDGFFGPLTTSAVKKFQSAHPPLVVDGIVGEQTWTALCVADVPPGQEAAVDIGPATIEPETSVDIGPAVPEDSVEIGPAVPEEGFSDEPFPSN